MLRNFTKLIQRVHTEPSVPQDMLLKIKGHQQIFQRTYQAGQYKQALEECDAYLSIVSRYYGEDHPASLSMRGNKGLILSRIGRLQEALQIQQTVAQHYTNLLGPDHRSTIIALINLAKSLRRNSEIPQAMKLLLDIETLSTAHKDLLVDARINLAACNRDSGQYIKAQEIYDKLIQDPSLPNRADLLNDKGLTHKLMGQFEEAEQNYKESLTLKQKSLPVNHPQILIIYHNLGELYSAWKKPDLAQKFFNLALEIIETRI